MKPLKITTSGSALNDVASMRKLIKDRRVIEYDPLIQPALVHHEIPSSPFSQQTIAEARLAVSRIIAGQDDRLIVIVGPCTIHDPQEAIEYAKHLRDHMPKWDKLLIIMRAHFQKPVTTVGWRGLIHDPDVDGSYQINKGLRTARQVLCDITSLGVPVGSQLLDTISPQYLADLLSWGSIGARATESQLHRDLASGVSFPIGFKNGTDGGFKVAVDAMIAASSRHAFMGITDMGLPAIVKTSGNPDVHVILRGGTSGPNCSSDHVKKVVDSLRKAFPDRHPAIMISIQGNSQKNHLDQPEVLASICEQLRSGEPAIVGVMIESDPSTGKQELTPVSQGGAQLAKYDVDTREAPVDWATSRVMLDRLNEAVKQRSVEQKSSDRPSSG